MPKQHPTEQKSEGNPEVDNSLRRLKNSSRNLQLKI
jgi:hypothetical protein